MKESQKSDITGTRYKYKVVSLFSGAMGLDYGMFLTGRFQLLAAVEKEHAFCETIRANQFAGNIDQGAIIYETDIRNLEPETILSDLCLSEGEIDVVVGGPPCQSFSTAGRRGTVQDPRGTLLWEFLRFVSVLKPKIFLMENVRGLMSAAIKHRPISERPDRGGKQLEPDEQPGSVIKLFTNDLEKIEPPYRLDCFEVNAVNYGAPQLRERALFIGNRYNIEIEFPAPTHGPKDSTNPEQELFDCAKLKPWATLGDALLGLLEVDPVIMDFSQRKKFYLSLVPPGGNWRHLSDEIQRESMGKAYYAKGGRSGWWRRLSLDLPCPTLVTMPNHASTALTHPTEVRALTVREYCRIQEFPDEWKVVGTPSEQYAQIGNAVPVRLGTISGETIVNALDKLSTKNWKIDTGPPKPYRRVYIKSHVRTRHWYKNGEAMSWKDGEFNGTVAYSNMKTNQTWDVLDEGA